MRCEERGARNEFRQARSIRLRAVSGRMPALASILIGGAGAANRGRREGQRRRHSLLAPLSSFL